MQVISIDSICLTCSLSSGQNPAEIESVASVLEGQDRGMIIDLDAEADRQWLENLETLVG
jgi:hypothetical protein